MTGGGSMRRYLVVLVCGLWVFCAACKKEIAKNTAGPGDFAITDVLIGSGAKNIETPTNKFTIKTPVRISYDVANCTAMMVNGVPIIWLRQDAIVRDEKGNVVKILPAIIDKKIAVANKPLKYENEISLAGIDGLKKGRYEISLLATDLVSFHTSAYSLLIRIEQ
jgi:hypothetical protein